MCNSLISSHETSDGVDLILHQCNQRRDHYGGAGQKKRRELVAQGLSASCRHYHERVVAVQKIQNDFFLVTLEMAEAEELIEFGVYCHIVNIHR